MQIVFVHPNYRSGGAEIAGSWHPARVAYLAGHLRKAGFTIRGEVRAFAAATCSAA